MAFKGRKASLELSIRAIVIVVLAMTLLGLGLGFVKNMFSNIDILATTTFDKISEQLQKDLISSDEKLIFSQSKITVSRGKPILLAWGLKNDNPQALNYFPEFKAIKCPLGADDTPKCPKTEKTSNGPKGAQGDPSHPDGLNAKSELNEEWFSFKYSGIINDEVGPGSLPPDKCGALEKYAVCWGIQAKNLYTLGPAEDHVKRVDLSIPRTAQPGLYLIELRIYDYDIPDNTNTDYNEIIYASTEIFLTVG